jgi:glycosyltransferase involved in cell wall biosynthesis
LIRAYQVLAPARFGGAETVCLSLASVLPAVGVECTLVLLVGAEVPDELLARAERLAVATIVLRHGRRGYHRDVRALYQLVARDDAAVLHSHLARANLVTRATAALARRPCVATLHGHSGSTMSHRLHDAIYLRVLRSMDAMVCVSHATAGAIRQRSPGRADRVHTIPSALLEEGAQARESARDMLGVPHDRTLVGWVGRFVPVKHPELFVRSVAELASRTALPEPWNAMMVGDGPLLGSVRELAESLGIGDRVIFSGFRPDAGRLAPAFDVLAISSRCEELPTVLLECLGRGVPVVSTPVGDVPRIALHCTAVRIASATPAGFAEALSSALAMRRDRPELTGLAREYILRDHVPSAWAERHRALYAQLLQRLRPRHTTPVPGVRLP